MAQLPWIQGFLFIILQLTVTAERTSVIKRAGDEAMLSCSELIDGQQNCRDTTWRFSVFGRGTEALVSLGQNNSYKPDRLSLTSNCSLVIKKVREEDAGRYQCQQWNTRDKHNHILFHESDIYLSVVNLTEQKENHRVTLSCSVVTFDPCPYKVQWFYQDVTNKESPSESVCSATVTLSSGSKVPQCKVTQSGSNEEFTFSLQPSGGKVQPTRKPGNRKTTRPNQNNVPPTPEEKSGEVQPTTKPASRTTTRPKPDNVSKTLEALCRIIIVSVGLAALSLTVVSVNNWTRTKMRKRNETV